MMQRTRKKLHATPALHHRTTALSIVFVLMGIFITTRLFVLQVVNHSWYEALASGQHELLQELLPQRGEIFAQTETGLYPLAVNRDTYVVYAAPVEIQDPQTVASGLLPWYTEVLLRQQPPLDEADETTPTPEQVPVVVDVASESETDQQAVESEQDPVLSELIAILSKTNDPYEPLLKGVTKEEINALNALELEGIHWLPIPSRLYPDGSIGSHTLGFFSSLSDEKKGQYGLEGYWDQILQGTQGVLLSEKDALGSQIVPLTQTLHQGEDGADLIVTIDPAIQQQACNKLDEYVERFQASGGSVIILEPYSGAVLAMCGAPSFDPNSYNQVNDIGVYSHPAIAATYEPGSIMKPLTMAAGLDSGVVTPTSTYFDEGEYHISGFTIRNSDLESHGEQTMINVLEKSLNTGAIYVAEQVGSGLFKKYLQSFGFGEATGIELSGEAQGTLRSLDNKAFIYTATASFGQGITVTPIQMVAAYVPVANGGKLYKPYLVKEIRYSDGAIQTHDPVLVRSVISEQSAALLAGMMVSVIKNGHAIKAGVPGYLLAGKTGTAQLVGDAGGYGRDTIHSFVGFGPVEDPRFVMLTKLDRPKMTYASETAAPLFGEIANFILKYYHVPPTDSFDH